MATERESGEQEPFMSYSGSREAVCLALFTETVQVMLDMPNLSSLSASRTGQRLGKRNKWQLEPGSSIPQRSTMERCENKEKVGVMLPSRWILKLKTEKRMHALSGYGCTS